MSTSNDFTRFSELAMLVMTNKANQQERDEFLALNAKTQEIANKIEAENAVSVLVQKIIDDFKVAYKSGFKTYDDISNFLNSARKLIPGKRGTNSTGTSPIKPVEGEPSANSYQFYVKKALTDKSGQTLTLAEIGEVVVAGKPETAALNKAGKPLWDVYVQRAATWFPENVTKTGKGDTATFVWNEKK